MNEERRKGKKAKTSVCKEEVSKEDSSAKDERESVLEEVKNPEDEIKKKDEEIAALKQEVKSFLEKFQRLGADFDNYKKRQENELSKARKFGLIDCLRSLMPFMDSFILAKSTDNEAKKSLEILWGQLVQILENLGFQIIDPKIGDDFDPNFHESISSEEKDGVEEGKILDVYQVGFMIESQIVRPARVKVSIKKEKENEDKK